MSIDKKTVQHVALLSRLSLDEKELELYAAQLGLILEYIQKLNKLDLASTPPTSHAVRTLTNVDRPDEPKGSLPVEDALVNAPEKEGDFFKIPKVIEGKGH